MFKVQTRKTFGLVINQLPIWQLLLFDHFLNENSTTKEEILQTEENEKPRGRLKNYLNHGDIQNI